MNIFNFFIAVVGVVPVFVDPSVHIEGDIWVVDKLEFVLCVPNTYDIPVVVY